MQVNLAYNYWIKSRQSHFTLKKLQNRFFFLFLFVSFFFQSNLQKENLEICQIASMYMSYTQLSREASQWSPRSLKKGLNWNENLRKKKN